MFNSCTKIIYNTSVESIFLIFQWESKVERGQENFDKISKMIKLEMERFEVCRIQDFKETFVKYLENHMEHQAQVNKPNNNL